MSDQPMIYVERVSVRYGRHEPIFSEVSFALQPGEFAYLTGPTGTGKSTLLRLLFRELIPTEGKIYVAGADLSAIRARELAHFRRQVGVVFQDFRLLPERSVFENVALALRVQGTASSEIKERVHQIISRVGLVNRRNARPEELSGGEQQRVAIARAMVNNPRILLADEPTGNLDPSLAVEIMNLFESFSERGTTVLIATHDTSRGSARQKRILRLDHGHLRETYA